MVGGMIRGMQPFLAALVVLAGADSAAAAVGAWGQGQRAEARIVAAGIGADGTLNAGVEIGLPDGWHTYWRTPGDAGVAPTIDFSASGNLGPAAVSFPVPTRLDDGFSVTNVYKANVVLPVNAAVIDRSRPVDLVARLAIGVCSDVCVPDTIEARLTIPAGENDAAAAATLADAGKAVPGAAEPGVFALAAIARTGGTEGRPVFRVTGTVPDAHDATVFVEGPEGWAAYTPDYQPGNQADGGKDAWTVQFDRLGAHTPIAGAAFRFTIVSGDRAIDQTLTLQ
jgi:DsbC/DsbD-like thiol-disulfide interchange protein